jgi:hemolysin III
VQLQEGAVAPKAASRPERAWSDAGFPLYSPAERRADALVHAVGLGLALIGCVVLGTALLTHPSASPALVLALVLYAAGLVAMPACSALYNLAGEGPRKGFFRRLDHAAIFLMIAGTYSPFALVAIGGAWGAGLLAFVWAAALAGIAVELSGMRRPDGLMIAAYLLLGWTILAAIGPLAAAVSTQGLALLAAGGLLYSAGVAFHLSTHLPFQNAIWHGLVFTAAICHYAAVLHEIV